MIAEPPLDVGAVHETTDLPLALEVAVTPVEVPGTVEGVAPAEAMEELPVPEALVAVTVKV